MGRRRSGATRDLPANLYPNKGGFKYRHPQSRKEFFMGCDRGQAIAAAQALNAQLVASVDLVARVMDEGQTVGDAIAAFRADDMPGRKWAPATASVYESVLTRMQAAIGDRALDSFGVKECATFIRTVTASPRGRQQFRLVLTWVLACAVQEGWIETNPATSTRKSNYESQRARLEWRQYQAIHAHAPRWLQNAMDLSLLTLLRREDIALLRFADVRDGSLWVVPGKTEDSSGVRLKIRLSDDLAALVARCRDAALSPYIVHRRPESAKARDQKAVARKHHTQVLPEQISRAFADAREAAGIVGKNPPTFHEIRSLGGALLRDRGWTLPQVQALMGHASEGMTKHYMQGHDAPWVEVSPGLSLTG